eukprot:CAMPEP_0174736366 /NCGR_PEP_ID=MMETSP1094-20130205/66556_1 /TAXON_ID=156173 /ORGANISM="Chrysochromulina brevifilum, Strain UTEX LB 985" /LENGTH=176 /DNA_ID=CAMNT_0015939447 /DNA_START=64 /DNA_END=594 /DNA_ORIENTATION=+
MSFVDGLSATASVALKHSRAQAVKSFVDKFKAACTERSGNGFFSAEGCYGFTIDNTAVASPHRAIVPQATMTANVMIKECAAENREAFNKALDTAIKELGFKDATCTITWPDSGAIQVYHQYPYRHRMDGSVTIKATWPSTPSGGAASSSGVKRERDEGSSPATAGGNLRVCSRRR